jgi:hypothetical protein
MYKKYEKIDMSSGFFIFMSKKLENFDMKACYVDGIDITKLNPYDSPTLGFE